MTRRQTDNFMMTSRYGKRFRSLYGIATRFRWDIEQSHLKTGVLVCLFFKIFDNWRYMYFRLNLSHSAHQSLFMMVVARRRQAINMSHKFHDALVPYATVHHFLTATKWCIMVYFAEALWDLWDGSIAHLQTQRWRSSYPVLERARHLMG